jgi:hypothetical protein
MHHTLVADLCKKLLETEFELLLRVAAFDFVLSSARLLGNLPTAVILSLLERFYYSFGP